MASRRDPTERKYVAAAIKQIRKDIRHGKCSLADHGVNMIALHRLTGPGRVKRATYVSLVKAVDRCVARRNSARDPFPLEMIKAIQRKKRGG